MTSVYSGSKINIAAAGARDGTEGCFIQSPGYTKGVFVEDTVAGHRVACTFVKFELYLDLIDSTHLASRAWALQVSHILMFQFPIIVCTRTSSLISSASKNLFMIDLC